MYCIWILHRFPVIKQGYKADDAFELANAKEKFLSKAPLSICSHIYSVKIDCISMLYIKAYVQ